MYITHSRPTRMPRDPVSKPGLGLVGAQVDGRNTNQASTYILNFLASRAGRIKSLSSPLSIRHFCYPNLKSINPSGIEKPQHRDCGTTQGRVTYIKTIITIKPSNYNTGQMRSFLFTKRSNRTYCLESSSSTSSSSRWATCPLKRPDSSLEENLPRAATETKGADCRPGQTDN